jgi:hypothetical protein
MSDVLTMQAFRGPVRAADVVQVMGSAGENT